MIPGSFRHRWRILAVSTLWLTTGGCNDSPTGQESAVTSPTEATSPVTTAESLPSVPGALGRTSGNLAAAEGTLVFEVKGPHLCVYLRSEGRQDLLVLFDNPVVTRSTDGYVVAANGAETLRNGDTISTGGGAVRQDILASLDLGDCDDPDVVVWELGRL